ncbi:FitA-like ribbon-helix-helix domain-containing protein [Falsiroseomonas sp.]|uniref:FitA-like ribbon-helix-helix domain-containing protein n=1 Tax=Falsiroseomonas sp. TaxID=2870721 RepID=UPI003F707DBE
MAQVLVRQVEEAVVEALKRKAAARGNSLEGYVRELLTRDASETRAEIVARLRARLAAQPVSSCDSSTLLRDLRDGKDEMAGDEAA